MATYNDTRLDRLKRESSWTFDFVPAADRQQGKGRQERRHQGNHITDVIFPFINVNMTLHFDFFLVIENILAILFVTILLVNIYIFTIRYGNLMYNYVMILYLLY